VDGAAAAFKMKKKQSAKKKTGHDRGRWRRGISPRVVGLIFLLVICIGVVISPVARNLEATGRLKSMEKELARQKQITGSLDREVSDARSLDYIEKEARKGRLVKPGEILYLVTTNANAPEVEYRLKALQSMDEAWESIRWRLHCNASRQVSGQ